MDPIPPAPTSRCAECGDEIRCGAVLGEERCWCQDVPAVTPRVVEGEVPACLCERCLRKRAAAEGSRA